MTPDGSPLPGAVVVARGLDDDIRGVRLHARSRADGTFELWVPHGRYRLGAVYRRPGWLKPVEREVMVPAGGVSGGHMLQFRQPDAQLNGTLIVTDTVAEGAGARLGLVGGRGVRDEALHCDPGEWCEPGHWNVSARRYLGHCVACGRRFRGPGEPTGRGLAPWW
ncbi:MAG: carboxypeptidase-like regulatory domain-containing protein [Ardenticatenia bacterium]|nr:carboxypeptidase-like regulatory domain-containing protein [Ardenticatenia bacterium]